MQCAICAKPLPMNADRCPLCRVPLQRRCFHCRSLNPVDEQKCRSCSRPFSELPVDQDAVPATPPVVAGRTAVWLRIIAAVLIIGGVVAYVGREIRLEFALPLAVMSVVLFAIGGIVRRTEEVSLRPDRLEGFVRDRAKQE